MGGIGEWLRRLRGRGTSEARTAEASAPRPSPPPVNDAALRLVEASNTELDAIRDVEPDRAESVAAATAALRHLRGTGAEGAAIAAVIAAKRAGRSAPALSVMAADVLVQRGEPDLALSLLAELEDPGALLLSADVRASAGELEAALALVDRVLARDVSVAGARDRCERWRAMLGRDGPPIHDASATLLEPALERIPLRIVGEAGRGGAGVVYEAFDERLGRRVALKVYHRVERDRDKIEREAKLPVLLTGAGVVRVFDADPAYGWIAMEWLDGGSLKRRIVEREIALLVPIERWFVPLARTLARVHAAGYVHADVKPANVLFRSTSEPVLSDFGIAREIGAASADGSIGFMSPERVAQRPLVPADDVYALGAVLDAVLAVLQGPDPRWRAVAEVARAADRPASAGELLRCDAVPL